VPPGIPLNSFRGAFTTTKIGEQGVYGANPLESEVERDA